jgi:hypothetical protein
MVSSVGYGTVSTPSMQRASVSGDASADAAQAAAGNAIASGQPQASQAATTQPAQPGVTVSISPEGEAAAARVQQADSVESNGNASANASVATLSDTDTHTGSADATPIHVSPVKAFAYGALGLERPDQPQDERNSFYSAGKWLAAGLTIGGLISLLV